jgi:hypothetical protein
MRTMHPRATCHSVALSCTASVINIDAAANNNATAADAAASYNATAADAMSAAAAFAFSGPYRTECSHKNAGLAFQDARTDINVDRTRARPTAAATTRSNVCCTNARWLPSRYCCYEVPARHVSYTVPRSVRCRHTCQVTIAPSASRPSFSRDNQPARQPDYVTFLVFSPAWTDYYEQRQYRQRSQPKFLPLFVSDKSPDGIRVNR